jgi:hypothetical protein
MADKMATKNLQSKLPAKMRNANEEVEQIDEIGDTPRGKAALTNLASQRFGRARWAAGVHRATSRDKADHGDSPHSRLRDKDNTVAKKAAGKAGIASKDVPDHNYDYDKKGGYGTKVADPAHKLADRNKPKMEEVEGLDELSTEKLLKYREAAKKDADVKNKAWDKKKLSDEGKYKLMNRETGTDQADQKIKRKTGSYRPGILARVGARLRNEEVEELDEMRKDTLKSYLKKSKGRSDEMHDKGDRAKTEKEADFFYGKRDKVSKSRKGAELRVKHGVYQSKKGPRRYNAEEVEQIDEVDHPKNQADMLAHIMHQIKIADHPVALPHQFTATHCKDTTKKASLEPGQDKLQYAIAQGGNIKP